VYFLDKDDKKGVPATLTITGDTFDLTSDSLKGSGLISAVKSCGDTSIALKFGHAIGEATATIASLLRSSISLDTRIAGGTMSSYDDFESLHTDRAIILATARDDAGRLAGADIAFVICPPYPKCKRYPSCPCPDPGK
jgi:hypothetical protein